MTTRTCHATSWLSKTQWIKVCVLMLPKKMRRRKMNKHSRQVGVLSSNLISWPDLERPALKYRNCSHGMVWLAPHQAWYLAGCYVCILKGIAKTYDLNVLPNQAKNIFPSPHILQFSSSVQYVFKGMAIPFTLAKNYKTSLLQIFESGQTW